MREDISDYLIHFTQGDDETAFVSLQNIIHQQKLLGGSKYIMGKFPCVCFTEAPGEHLGHGFSSSYGSSRYSLFGIKVSKKWLFDRGGRPVIYQPEADFQLLPHELQWRHMTYELRDSMRQLDFLWEREWRIQTEELRFSPKEVEIVVPARVWADRLGDEYDRAQSYEVAAWSVVIGDSAQGYYNPFTWTVRCLDE